MVRLYYLNLFVYDNDMTIHMPIVLYVLCSTYSTYDVRTVCIFFEYEKMQVHRTMYLLSVAVAIVHTQRVLYIYYYHIIWHFIIYAIRIIYM